MRVVIAPTYERYSLDGLVAQLEPLGVTRRMINRWVTKRLIPPAHGSARNCRWAYYDATHVRAIKALLAVRHNNTSFADLAAFLEEEGISITQYAERRGIVSYA